MRLSPVLLAGLRVQSHANEMTEVRRSYMCHECGLKFVVVFGANDHLVDATVRVDCPRDVDGAPNDSEPERPRCSGFTLTQLPEKYSVTPAD
jgi:DNA-directed RNA polymerase subunit RPC12/RpoP